PADHHGRRLARGVRIGTRGQTHRRPAPQARLLPEPGHHLARADRAGDQGSRPDALLQVVRRVRSRSRRTSEIGGHTGSGCMQNWVSAFWTGSDHILVTLHAISPEAMTTYGDRLCALFAEGGAF